jgi:hypothetical protein
VGLANHVGVDKLLACERFRWDVEAKQVAIYCAP